MGYCPHERLLPLLTLPARCSLGWIPVHKDCISFKNGCVYHNRHYFKAVDESYTTQTCSSCGALPESRPRGIAGLGIRAWACSACSVTHDRDMNAARNILAVGHGRLVVGIPH